MKIVHAYPPNIDQIDEVFKVRGTPGVVYTYGDTIYVPDGSVVSPSLKSHEGVHYSRQTNDRGAIEAWWARYLTDAEFRLAEELPAHRAEFRTFCALHKDRTLQMRMLHAIADRLAGPLYGGLISASRARNLIHAR